MTNSILFALALSMIAIILVLGSILAQDFEKNVRICVETTNYSEETCIKELSR